MACMQGMQGFLLKANREYRRANVLVRLWSWHSCRWGAAARPDKRRVNGLVKPGQGALPATHIHPAAPPPRLQGKWKRRWVQLTSATLVYSNSVEDAAAGRLQVFSMHECAAVRREGDAKFTVGAHCSRGWAPAQRWARACAGAQP